MAASLPGPYAYDPDDGSLQHVKSGMEIASLSRADDFPCRDTEQDRDFEAEIDATGRLLAAAPDLLVQLKGLLGFAEFVISAVDIDIEATKVVLKNKGKAVAEVPIAVLLTHSRSAIAKAEGR